MTEDGSILRVREILPSVRATKHIANEETLRQVLRLTGGIVWEVDRELRVTALSRGRNSTAIVDPAHVIGAKLHDVVAKVDPTETLLHCHSRAIAGEPQAFCYLFGGRSFEVCIEPRREAEQVVGCIGAAVEVTAQKQLQEHVNVTLRRFAEAQEVAHIGSFEWEIAANVVTWSEEMHRIYGIPREAFRGSYETFLHAVHPDDAVATRRIIAQALAETGPIEYEHRIVQPSGSVRLLRTRANVMRDEQGRPVRLVGSCWDTTTVAEATRRLEHSISLLEATLNATADGLLVVDLECKIVAHNQRFLSMWHIPADLAARGDDNALLGYVSDQLADPQGFLRRVRERYSQLGQEGYDTLLFKDGRVFERFSAPQRQDGRVIGRVWSFHDVTDREHATQEAKDAVGILAMAAHDIRSPLSGLSLQLDLMRRSIEGGRTEAPKLRQQLEACHRFVERANTLLTSLLDATRIGVGKLELAPEPIDLDRLVHDVVARAELEVRASNCDVTIRTDEAVAGVWDARRLEQIIGNLLSNALKYGRGKPVEVRVRRGTGNTGLVQLRDHGPGVAASDQERIFGQFERAVAGGEGVGLGLWIARKLASALGGHLLVESNAGQGSTFTLVLPLTAPMKGSHGSDPSRR